MVVERLDDFGVVGCMRFNMLHPPFDNVKLRRAMLPAINQADFMNAAMGGDPELTRIGVGVFTPGSPLANSAGLETLTGPRDLALAKKLVAESGYAGEKIVFIAPTDYPVLNAECLVGADLLGKLGINVDLQGMDWGTMIQRRNNKDTIDKGGWSAFCTGWEGLNLVDPGAHYPIAGTGEKGWFGWFSSEKMEELRTAWFDAPDLATQKKVAEQIQLDVWEEAPYYPLGQWLQPIAHRTTIEGIVKSPFPLFWNVRKSRSAVPLAPIPHPARSTPPTRPRPTASDNGRYPAHATWRQAALRRDADAPARGSPPADTRSRSPTISAARNSAASPGRASLPPDAACSVPAPTPSSHRRGLRTSASLHPRVTDRW